MGAPTPEMVEKRAREIALIGERNPDEFTDGDWDQAQAELLGIENDQAPEETKENASLQDDWTIVAGSTGERAPRNGFEDDEESLGAHLVEGGIEEATHDSMVQARRDELSREGGVDEGA